MRLPSAFLEILEIRFTNESLQNFTLPKFCEQKFSGNLKKTWFGRVSRAREVKTR